MLLTKILIVEDEIELALNVRETLEAAGYEVTDTVASGEAAIAAAESNRPDLILMDIRLTGKLDGIQAATILRERFDIPAVYTTANNDRDTLELDKISEPYGYIIKPFAIQELVSIIENSLYKHGLQAKLKERDRWLASTLRSIGDAVIATDLNYRIVFMNPIAEGLTGWPLEVALGKELPEVFRIVDAKTLEDKENPVAKVLRDGIIVDFCCSILIARDGTKIPIDDSASLIKDDAGNITGAVLVFHDIIECKKTEEKLRQSDRRWRGVFDRAFNFIWLLQLDGTLEEANQTALDFAGIRAEDVIGHPFWQWPWWLAADFRPDIIKSEGQYLAVLQTQEELKEAIARAVAGESVRYDMEILAPESAEMTVDFSINPVSAAGRVLFLVAEGRDITARKQMELAQQERGEQLERSVQERTAELQAAVQQLEAEIQERQRAEEELQQSEERFRNLVETTSDLVWEADENGAYTYISPKVRDLLGYEPSEILGNTWFELLDVSQTREIMAAREPFHCLEKITRHKDGRRIVMETSAVPFFDSQGCFRGYRGIDRDIGDRSSAIEALRESEEKFRRLFEEAPIGMNLTDSSGRYIQANPAFCRMLGYTEEELKGQKFLSFIHPEDIQKEIPYMQRLWHVRNKTYRMEKRYIQKSGEIIWTKMTSGSIRDGMGNLRYGLAMVEDISDRLLVEETLKLRERAIEASSNGIVIADAKQPDLPVIYVNPAFEKITGYRAAEVLGKNCRFLQGRDTDRRELDKLRLALKAGSACTVILRNYRKDGSLFWNELSVSPIRDARGSLSHFLGIQNDIKSG